MPHAPDYTGALNAAMAEFQIDSAARQAAFLAQIAHESGELRWLTEFASGEEYEGRKDLGNVKPGDGKRYRGRGFIQLTGRDGYRRAGAALGLDLEGSPETAAVPSVAARVAGWFWTAKKLNALADQGRFAAITLRVNGGDRGEAERERYWAAAKCALGAK